MTATDILKPTLWSDWFCLIFTVLTTGLLCVTQLPHQPSTTDDDQVCDHYYNRTSEICKTTCDCSCLCGLAFILFSF